KLNTPPLGNVTISLTDNDSDNSEISYSPTSLTFDSSNWNNLQTVTFSALEDSIVDGNQTINLDVAVSSDVVETYSNVMNTSRTVMVNDSGLAKPSLDNITVGEQQLTIYWQAQSVPDTYTLYWVDSDSPQNSGNFTISNSPTSTYYVHGALNSSLNYTYHLAANIGSSTSDNSTPLTSSPNALAGCTTSGTLADNDSNLILHYGFNNNLEDNRDTFGDSRYDLSNPSGTIKYAQSCAYGRAAYFDSTTGYLENTGFDDSSNSNLFSSGNFTIAMWFLADADMDAYTSLMSSKTIPSSGNPTDSGNWSFQIDDDGSDKIRWRSAQGGKVVAPHITHTSTSSTYSKNQWYYTTFVKYDNGTGQIYMDGVLQATSTGTQHSPLESLRIGVNRTANRTWKGYIDEFKVYNKAFDQDDVKDACLLYDQCDNLTTPAKPDNLTAVVGSTSGQVDLSWNSV
ncbi:MAG: LamG domain-containing protein, partial [SAR324 cluster bacterium]|nr:LamG domain-containing protein [SAR324 cluster bacterium]